MSATTTPAATPETTTPTPSKFSVLAATAQVVDSLSSPQFVVTICFIAVIIFVLAKIMVTADAAMQDKVLTLAGNIAMAIIGYWLGSSVSSQRKDALVTPPPTPPPGATP